jgi:hypothetical protein
LRREILIAATLLLATLSCLADTEVWVGRRLVDILTELRTNGIPLIYSSQIVDSELRVSREPTGQQPIERLQAVLKSIGLIAKPLKNPRDGFIIVRAPVTAQGREPSSIVVSPLEEVTVFASRYSVTREQPTEAVDQSRATLERTSGIEEDALRTLHYLPGTASNSVSALAHVRGGAENETLVQYDGVELYNPVHLKDFQGLFGLMDPQFVQSLDFFSGGFPARFGNHTSGVLDIHPRQTTDTSTLLGVSLLYDRAVTSGSFDGEQGTWLFGYRYSNLPDLLSHLKRKIGDPRIDDFIGRVSYDWHGSKFTVGTLGLNDDLQLYTPAKSEQTSARYRDSYLWLRYDEGWSDRLSSHVLVSHAELTSDREATVNHSLISNGTLSRIRSTTINSVQMAWTFALNAITAFDWGIRADHGHTRSAVAAQAVFLEPLATTFAVPGPLVQQVASEVQADIYSAYCSALLHVDAWTGELGLRWDEYGHLDQAKVVSPRLNLRYALTEHSSVHLSADRYVQARTLNNVDAATVSSVSPKPESSRQLILGVDHRFDNQLNLRVEAYAKRNDHVRSYSENLLDIVTLAPELKIDRVTVAPQSASARGVEISLRSPQNTPLTWWATYGWSQARDRIGGADVPRSWDQPHALTAGLVWLKARWQYSAAVTWHSGWPYTPLIVSRVDGSDTATLGPRNSQRFGQFVSLELRTQYTVPMPVGALELFFEVRNAFDRANDCCRDVTVTQTTDGKFNIAIQQKSWLNVVPLAGVNWRF